MTDIDPGQALAALTCPYYQGYGSCGGGCHEEPMCMVDEPEHGWELPVPYGLHVLDEIRETAEEMRKRAEVERWLAAETQWETRPILESRQFPCYGVPHDVPNGVYPLNPRAPRYAKGDRWVAVYNTRAGGGMSMFPTRGQGDAYIEASVARSRRFWEEKIAWMNNGDVARANNQLSEVQESAAYHGYSKPPPGRGGGRRNVLRHDGWHYVVRTFGVDLADRDCKGFGGAVFRWRWLDEPAGTVHESNDVMGQGQIPDDFRDRLPDNVQFVDNKFATPTAVL